MVGCEGKERGLGGGDYRAGKGVKDKDESVRSKEQARNGTE